MGGNLAIQIDIIFQKQNTAVVNEERLNPNTGSNEEAL